MWKGILVARKKYALSRTPNLSQGPAARTYDVEERGDADAVAPQMETTVSFSLHLNLFTIYRGLLPAPTPGSCSRKHHLPAQSYLQAINSSQSQPGQSTGCGGSKLLLVNSSRAGNSNTHALHSPTPGSSGGSDTIRPLSHMPRSFFSNDSNSSGI